MDRRRHDDRQRRRTKCPGRRHREPVHPRHGCSLPREIDEPLDPALERGLFVDRPERADRQPLPLLTEAGSHLHEHLRQLKAVALGQHDVVVADLLASLCQAAVEPMHRRAPPEDRGHGVLEEAYPEIAVGHVCCLVQQDSGEFLTIERGRHAGGQHNDRPHRPDHDRHRHRRRLIKTRRLGEADRPRRLTQQIDGGRARGRREGASQGSQAEEITDHPAHGEHEDSEPHPEQARGHLAEGGHSHRHHGRLRDSLRPHGLLAR